MYTSMNFHSALRSVALLGALGVLGATGCKSPASTDDATIANNVRSAVSSDASINKEAIQTSVANGVVTLNGTVTNDTARLVASEDVSRVAGVKQVVNNLSVMPPALATTPTPAGSSGTPAYVPPAAVPPAPGAPSGAGPARSGTRVSTREEREAMRRQQYPTRDNGPVQQGPPPPPVQQPVQVASAPPPPPPPPVPVYRDIRVPAGMNVSVRVTQTLDSATALPDTQFTGALAAPLVVEGETIIPAGAPVTGRIVTVHEAGHFSGNSLLTVELTSISRRGERITVGSDPYTVEGKGRGKNTAEKAGGGAVVGGILGGIFGGGKGAAIGAASGGALGAGSNGITRGQQVQIPSESVVRFRLVNGFSVRTRTGEGDRHGEPNQYQNPNDGSLQRRNP